MIFDFSALLVLLTLGSGLIWGGDALLFAPRRRAAAGAGSERPPEPVLVNYARSFFPIFLAVLILRSFIVEPFRIPSASMMPTLLRGDFILVNKYEYGVRLPVLNTRVIANSAPQRGDIIVFRYPEDPAVPFIKRVVATPGDHVRYKNKRLTINGQEVELSSRGVYYNSGSGRTENGARWLREKLGDKTHDILINPLRPPQVEIDRAIPEGHYFVLGDNRDNSRDSRYWGLVPDENLVGRAFYIWMNWSNDGFFNLKSWNMDWGRIGSVII